MITKLFNRTLLDQIQEWSIEVSDNSYRTHEGIVGGAITSSKWTYCKGKNTGRSNETTPEEQAIKQANSIVDKKIHAGYRYTIEELSSCDKGWFQPMLAHKWDNQLSKDAVIFVQPKFDGMRCIVRKEGMFSRNGKPIVGAPHIYEELKQVFEYFPDIILDGELYNHELKNDFNEIISHVRKTKPTEEDLQLSRDKIQYHCYDSIFKNDRFLTFETRYNIVVNIIINGDLKYVRSVETLLIPISQIHSYLEKYLEQGYEGLMIRLNTPYENRRSGSLLKYKQFIDEEFEVLDIEEGVGNRSGMMGRMFFKTKQGRQFTASSRGNEEYFKELLKNKTKYIGKMATVRYQNMTPDGSPRFPVVITIRDYE